MSGSSYNPKMLAAKEKLLERFRARAHQVEEPQGARQRLPPGQHLVSGFPVLDLGVRPAIDLATWKLKVTGQVREPWFFSWEAFRALPRARCRTCSSWRRPCAAAAGRSPRSRARRSDPWPAPRPRWRSFSS